jgi:hypothetical protein
MTLVSTSTASGEYLPLGYHCLVLDEGRTDSEYICGTLTSAKIGPKLYQWHDNQYRHHKGADVKISDFPLIERIKAQNNGEDTFSNPLL